jgi:L-lactate utilization protein LutC
MKYDTIASDETIEKVLSALPARNFIGYVVTNKEEALAKIKELIPSGASVMTGSSVTLEEIGFVDLLKSGTHPWDNLKDGITTEKDPVRQSRLRKEATMADYFLGSVHALTEDGQAVIASNTGSQLPAYAFNAPNVIWVVGAQKIVPNQDEAFKRIEEYVVPLEDVHMKQLYGSGTNLSKMLIYRKETGKRAIHVLIVKEKLGF